MSKIKSFELQLASSLDICNDPVKKLVANTANRIRKKHGLPELSLAFWEEDLHPRGEHGRFAPKGSSRSSGGGRGSSGGNEHTYHTPPSSRYGEFEGRTYNREEIQREMRSYEEGKKHEGQAKSRLQDFLEGFGIAAVGHYLPAVVGAAAKLTGAGAAKTAFASGATAGLGVVTKALGIGAAATGASPGIALLAAIVGGTLTLYGSYRMAKALLSASSYVIAKFATQATIGTARVVSEPFAEVGRGIYEGATS